MYQRYIFNRTVTGNGARMGLGFAATARGARRWAPAAAGARTRSQKPGRRKRGGTHSDTGTGDKAALPPAAGGRRDTARRAAGLQTRDEGQDTRVTARMGARLRAGSAAA